MAIGLGCMRLSTERDRDPARARAVLAAALAAGVDLLDTADAYALDDTEIGHNERLIADAVAAFAAPQAEVSGPTGPGGEPEVPAASAAPASATVAALGAPTVFGTTDAAARAALATSPGGARSVHDASRAAGGSAAARTVEIVTKGGLVRPGGRWLADGRARHLADAARASRDRLGVAAIDLYLLHAVDPQTPIETSVRALARLRDDGVVRRIGLSNITLTQLEAALAVAPIDAVEVELSPWKLDALRGGLVAACAARGIRVLAHRPLGGPAGVRRAGADPALAALAAQTGATPAELLLAWLRTLAPGPGPGIVPLPGATQIASAISAARAATLVLDVALKVALDARFLHLVRAHPWPASPPADPPSTISATGDAIISATGDAIISAAIGATGDAAGDAAIGATDDASPAEVVMIVGMPASGKSTLAAGHVARGYLRLNRDELGGTLLALARQLDRELTGGARRVVLDNTYASRASRAQVIEIARRHAIPVRCIVVMTALEDAQANAVRRILAHHGRLLMPRGPGVVDDELARAHEIDPRAQFRFRRDYEPPRDDEGFAAIEHVAFERRAATGGRPALIVELDDLVWRGRPRTPEAVMLQAGARDALHAWSAGHVLAGTTWQPGVASAAELAARLVELLGVTLHVVHCAHPAGPPVCWCRKPLPGLALALAHRHGLDLSRTLHVGKGPADRGFALRAGIRYADITAGWPAPGDH